MKGNWGLTLALVALAAVIGFFIGRRTFGEGDLAGAGGALTRDGISQPGKSARLGGGGGRNGSSAGGRHRGVSPEASIRGVVRELELSPMINMDFDALFTAYDSIRLMNPEEVQAALAELDGMETNPQIKMMLQMMLISRWSKEDGQGAVEFAMQQTQPMMKMMGLMGGMMGWVRQDPETAYAWYEEHRDEMQGGMMGRGQMDGIFFAALAQRDMDSAFERLGKLDKSSQQQALNAMAGQLVMDAVKRDEFLAKLDGLEDESMRNESIQRMVAGWAWQDPQEAVKFIKDGDFDDDLTKELMDSVSGSWMHTDPEAALSWRMESTEGEERSEAISEGFGRWISQDPTGAEKWLAKQPDELRTDKLYETASERLMWSNDYEKAVTYAEKIEDPDVQTARMKGIYTNWKGRDEEKAQEWLEGLDEPTRDKIQQPDVLGTEDPTMPWNTPESGEGGGEIGEE